MTNMRAFEAAIQREIALDPLAGTVEGHERDRANGHHNCPECGMTHYETDCQRIGLLRLYLAEVVKQRDELLASVESLPSEKE